jgi:hypothetical protein
MIIFLNGSINSGKSTIAKRLASLFDKTAVIEIDCLREFVRFLPLKEAIPINLKNAISVINNLRKAGIDCIVPYPLGRDDYDFIFSGLADYRKEMHFFTLSPRLESVIKNRGKRRLISNEIKRIKYHYSIGINKPNFGVVIDNTNQTPEQTTKMIYQRIILATRE